MQYIHSYVVLVMDRTSLSCQAPDRMLLLLCVLSASSRMFNARRHLRDWPRERSGSQRYSCNTHTSTFSSFLSISFCFFLTAQHLELLDQAANAEHPRLPLVFKFPLACTVTTDSGHLHSSAVTLCFTDIMGYACVWSV